MQKKQLTTQCRPRLSLIYRFTIACLMMFSSLTSGVPNASKAQQIKAGLIFNFVHFSRWPDNTFAEQTTPYQLCLIGQNRYVDIFKRLDNRTVRGRKLQSRELTLQADIQQLQRCHILFFHQNCQPGTVELLDKIATLPILTISENNDCETPPLMINFVDNYDNIGFAIHRKPGKQAGITFSSRMLRLAVAVTGGRRP